MLMLKFEYNRALKLLLLFFPSFFAYEANSLKFGDAIRIRPTVLTRIKCASF